VRIEEKKHMDLKTLENTPSWEWPETAAETLLAVLRDRSADPAERVLAAELAGEYSVMNNDLTETFYAILCDAGEPVELRGEAALSMGTALEHADTMGFEDPEEVIISERLFKQTRETLRRLFADPELPDDLRRQVLEASVHAPEDWHSQAVRDAYASDDSTWRVTAVFCMQFINGFDKQILESLQSRDLEIHYQAVCAAGNWGLKEAWPHITDLLGSNKTDKVLLLAAISAVPAIRPEAAEDILEEFAEHEDDEIAEAAMEALAMVEMMEEYEEEDEEDPED
jgi:uncharacterized protein (UPF0147 family)